MPDGGADGRVPLAAAIAALRQELLRAWMDGQDQQVRFKVAPVELTVQAQVTWSGEAGGGIKWWLIDANAKVSREQARTPTWFVCWAPTTPTP